MLLNAASWFDLKISTADALSTGAGPSSFCFFKKRTRRGGGCVTEVSAPMCATSLLHLKIFTADSLSTGAGPSSVLPGGERGGARVIERVCADVCKESF